MLDDLTEKNILLNIVQLRVIDILLLSMLPNKFK